MAEQILRLEMRIQDSGLFNALNDFLISRYGDNDSWVLYIIQDIRNVQPSREQMLRANEEGFTLADLEWLI